MRERDGMKERDGVRERDGRETRTRDRRDPETEREVTQPRLKGEKEEQMELERIRQRERYPDREDEEKRCKEKQDRETVSNMEEEAERETDPIMEQEADRETDPNMEQEADRSSGCMNESGPRAQTQVQSSGEWSSDIEDETKYQRESRERKGSEGEGDVDTEREHSEREKPNRVRAGEDQEEERIPKQPEQRKWWLEPQSGRHNHNSLEDDFLERESDIHSGIQKEKQGGEDTSVDVETERKQSGGNLGGKQRILRDSGRTIERQENIEQGPEGEIESVIETELNVDGEDNIEAWRDSGEEGHQTDNDEKTEETWPANSETEIENETDEIEESDRDEEGHYRYPHSDHQEDSEQKLEGEVERMPSTDDGFITVSSGGEEEFEDCKEFWESELERSRGRRYESERGRTDEQTQPQDAAVEGEGKGNKSSTYVFCVIGQTLSRSNPNQTAALGDMEPQGTYRNPGYDHSRSSDITRFPHEDFSKDGGQEAVEETRKERDLPKEEGLDTEEDSIVDIRSMTLEAGGRELLTVKEKNSNINTTPRRKSLTEVLLTEWRERQKEYAQTTATRTTEPEISPSSSHSREEEQRETSTAATSDHTIPRANSSEEAVAIRHHSGVWGPSETARRLSQAPHVKWARNVLSKILGRSEVPAPDNPPPGSLEGLEVTRDIEDEETSEGGGAALVKATGLKQTKRWMKEPGEGEEATGMGETLADMHAEAFTTIFGDGTLTDTHAGMTPYTTYDDTPAHRQVEEEGNGVCTERQVGEQVEGVNACADRQVESHIRADREGETEKVFEVGHEVRTTDEEKEANAQKEEDLFLSVSNTLYKPSSCPSLIYNTSPDESTSPQKENTERKEKDVNEEGSKVERRKGEGTEDEAQVKEEEKRGREKMERIGKVQVKSSFRYLGVSGQFRRKGFRKASERQGKEDEDDEEGGGGVARDRRTRIFPTSDDEEEGSFNWRSMEKNRRNSKFFNDQLYQQYSETAQNREILRQSRSDTLSVYDDVPVLSSPAPSPPPARRPLPPLPPVNHPHSASDSGSVSGISSGVSAQLLPLPQPPQPQAPTARPPSPRISISLSQSPTLWQELPGVRSSAEFAELTDDERRLQEVRFEVVTSEASYCRSIDIVVEHFVKSKQLGELLTTQDRNWLFSRLADVRAISHSFLSKLEERVESDMMHFTVCDIIARHCQRFKKVYVPYLTNQSYQDATYQRLMDENAGFRREVEKLERSPVCQRLPLRSFLILPFQRITRIKLLVQNIVKRTAQGTEEEVQAIKAMKLLEKLIQESNDSITQMKSIESLVSLSARVDFECRTLPLVSQSRRLVREGPVTELMEFSLKESERIVYLHLFNDYLLLSLHKEGGRFTVIDHAPVSELRAADCRAKLHTLQKSLFRLYLSNKALLLRTDTQSDKLRWISAVSRPHPVIDFAAEQDRTQMQCIRAFVAQQPDELSLEKAEVILVHQQSSDGWVEGTRLSDRQRGWTPVAHLETIASTRVRQRNLLDALKITAATAAM
ncbi:trichohyalin isoform X1 [Esox lucius]|nr:trichohyalin isoform X1 [Esox lucius]